MSRLELLRAGVFVVVVALVFLRAARILFGHWRETERPRPPLGRMQRAVLAAAGLGLLCIVYGRLVEPYWLDVTHRTIRSAKLAAGAAPLRIVHLSDIHSDPTPRLEGRLPDVVASLEPDLVVFTGDTANSPAGVPVFRRCIERIAAIAPTYVVKGNWDVAYFPEVERYDGTGVIELNGAPERTVVAGTPVQITGFAMWDDDRAEAAVRGLDPGVFTVFLYHAPYPDLIPDTASGVVDLMCAGHVHGGQVALPFFGALVTLSKHGKRYEQGLYRVGEAWLHLSRGVGMEGGSAPRVRFCARPEVTLIEVQPAE